MQGTDLEAGKKQSVLKSRLDQQTRCADNLSAGQQTEQNLNKRSHVYIGT